MGGSSSKAKQQKQANAAAGRDKADVAKDLQDAEKLKLIQMKLAEKKQNMGDANRKAAALRNARAPSDSAEKATGMSTMSNTCGGGCNCS